MESVRFTPVRRVSLELHPHADVHIHAPDTVEAIRDNVRTLGHAVYDVYQGIERETYATTSGCAG